MAVQPRLTFAQVREYLKGRDGEVTHVGGLTLDDLKRKFESNDTEMEKLRAERAEVKKRELADQVRRLKVEEAKSQTRRAQEKDEIERLHEEIAKLKEALSPLAVAHKPSPRSIHVGGGEGGEGGHAGGNS